MKKLKIVFWPHTTNNKVASYRIRCKKIVEELANKNNDITISYSKKIPKVADILILSKRYDEDSINKAIKLKEDYGTKLFLDICDNHFINNNNSRANQLITAINKVDHVISSTEYLANIIKKKINKKDNITVIGDIIEKPSTKNYKLFLNPLKFLEYHIFKYKLINKNTLKSRRFVWFGNFQGSYSNSGMSDLNKIRKELEEINLNYKISLTIISNSKNKFNSIFKNWKIDCLYIDWNILTFSKILMLHSVSIIPVSKNDFTYSKTDNRVTASLAHGLDVIADPVPSYIKHSNNIFISDWKNSFLKILNSDIRQQEKINYHVINDNVIRAWENTLISKLNKE